MVGLCLRDLLKRLRFIDDVVIKDLNVIHVDRAVWIWPKEFFTDKYLVQGFVITVKDTREIDITGLFKV